MAVALAALLALVAAAPPASAVGRRTRNEIRERYEGLSLRLRFDLKAAGPAAIPNVLSLEGIGYGRERSPVLFSRMEKVFIERVTSEGGNRLGLTVYRSEEEASRLRASAIPQPMTANPNFGRTMAAFAQQGSTSVVLELKADKNDPQAQLAEVETLMGRLFYRDEPSRVELEDFVRLNTTLPISRLRALTGLDTEEIRLLVDEAGGPAATPR